MANRTPSTMPALTGANLAADDLFFVVDVSASDPDDSATMTPAELLSGLLASSPNTAFQGSTFQSTVAVGTPPIAVTSTTVCSNLNVDKLDGLDANAFISKDPTLGTGNIINVPNMGVVGLSIESAAGVSSNIFQVYVDSVLAFAVGPDGLAVGSSIDAIVDAIVDSSISKAPASAAENTITPPTDIVPLTINATSGQTVPLQTWGVDGNVSAGVDKNGIISATEFNVGASNTVSYGATAGDVILLDAKSGTGLRVRNGDDTTFLDIYVGAAHFADPATTAADLAGAAIAADGTYTLPTSITIKNGIITAIS